MRSQKKIIYRNIRKTLNRSQEFFFEISITIEPSRFEVYQPLNEGERE